MKELLYPNTYVVKSKSRVEWIDFLRALAIFFVILGHQLPGKTAFFVFTSPIKIPLFFMITGFVFNYKRTSTKDFFKNLLLKLVLPWLILTVPFVLLKAPFKGISSIPTGLLDIISGNTVWYMPCCVIAEIIWFFTVKIGKKSALIIPLSLIVFAAGIAAGSFQVLDFAMINRALIAQFFILLGYLFKSFEDKIAKMKPISAVVSFVLYLAMGVTSLIIWPDSCLDVHLNRYYNYPFCFAMIILGGAFLFFTGITVCNRHGTEFPGLILFIGQNTLVFYILHGYNIRAFTYALNLVHIEIPFVPLVCLKVIVGFVLCGLEAMILLRFFPWALGRKKIKTAG